MWCESAKGTINRSKSVKDSDLAILEGRNAIPRLEVHANIPYLKVGEVGSIQSDLDDRPSHIVATYFIMSYFAVRGVAIAV